MLDKKWILLCLALVGAAGLSLWYQGRQSQPEVAKGLREGLIDRALIAQITGIELVKEAEKLSLGLDADKAWVLSDADSFPASGEYVLRFLEDMAKAKVLERVATESTQWPELGLEKPTVLTLKVGDKPAQVFHIGKTRSKGGVYVRIGDSPASYLVDSLPTIETSSKPWELKTLVDIKSEEVQEVSIVGQMTISRTQPTEAWTYTNLPAAKVLNQSELDKLLGNLRKLSYSQKIAKDPTLHGLYGQAGAKWLIKTFSGLQYELSFAVKEQEKAKHHYLSFKSDGGPKAPLMAKWVESYDFEVDSWNYDRFNKKPEDFLSLAPVSSPSPKVEPTPLVSPALAP